MSIINFINLLMIIFVGYNRFIKRKIRAEKNSFNITIFLSCFWKLSFLIILAKTKRRISSKKLFERLSKNKSHLPLIGNMADVLNETEILIGYWKSWCSRKIALLFRDDNSAHLFGMQSSHSCRSEPICCLYIKLFVHRFESIYFQTK